jgi:hypothetical protein
MQVFLHTFFICSKFRSIDRNQDELFQNIQSGVFEYLMPYWEGISECKSCFFLTFKNFNSKICLNFLKASKDLINHLLVVDAKKRWKAEDVLCHQWILTLGNSKQLPPNFDDMRKDHLKKLREKQKTYAAEPMAQM